MHALSKLTLAVAALAATPLAFAQITFYENYDFAGRSFSTARGVENFMREGFNDRASSIVIDRDRWQICDDVGYAGHCVELKPGRYPSLAAMGMNDRISSVRYVGAEARANDYRTAPERAAQSAAPQITFYEGEGFQGRSFSTAVGVKNFAREGFNDRAASIVIDRDRWQVCDNVGYGGRCVELHEGRYESLTEMGLNKRISSVRYLGEEPRAAAAPDFRRRDNERVYEANVTSVHAVMATPEKRCWVEREQVAAPEQSDNRVPGGIAGALLGGVIGHQIGGGNGKNLATAGGAVAGALLGSQIGGRTGTQQAAQTRDVERCDTTQRQTRPEYWDVTYAFRGIEHHMQMTTQPGPTVTVNRQGEPRI